MHLITTIIAILMLADALFALTNQEYVESVLKNFFPGMNVRQVALIEGGAALLILLVKLATNSFT